MPKANKMMYNNLVFIGLIINDVIRNSGSDYIDEIISVIIVVILDSVFAASI
jgi:hypothetical protein